MPRSPEAQRAYQAQRYNDYQQLCDALGVEPKSKDWQRHYTALKRGDEFRRMSREELQRWWLSKFPLEEIVQMGSALDTLLSEDEGREEAA